VPTFSDGTVQSAARPNLWGAAKLVGNSFAHRANRECTSILRPMSDLSKFLVPIVSNPLWVLLVAVATCLLLNPAKAVVARRVEASLDRAIDTYFQSDVLSRLVLFVSVVTAATGFLASLWCYFSTDLPPPVADPNVQHPLGPFATRLFGYFVIWTSCAMPFLGYLISRSEFPEAIASTGRQLPSALILGLLPSLAWIGYAAFVDRSLAYNFPLPPSGADVLVWWCSWVPLTSLAWGIVIYLVRMLVRGLWRLTAHIA